MTTPIGAEPSAAEPGVSNLIHLFADRFMPTAKGPLVYSRTDSNVGVNTETLATQLIAGAIWGLQESGLARLEQREDKKLGFVKVHRTHMWPIGDNATTPSSALDRMVLTLLRATTKHHNPEVGWTEYDLVRALVPKVELPYTWVVGTVLKDDAAKGYLTTEADKKGKRLVYAAVPDKIASLAAQASDLAQRWHAFTQSEPDMIKPLISHIRTAILGQKETDDS